MLLRSLWKSGSLLKLSARDEEALMISRIVWEIESRMVRGRSTMTVVKWSLGR